ncbi:hypothetical protein M3Y94_01028100 [Aphelenchoides besseyi]|nr:hypothetical protein M3Y94_01028100 [Aphelenchoides besseyi]
MVIQRRLKDKPRQCFLSFLNGRYDPDCRLDYYTTNDEKLASLRAIALRRLLINSDFLDAFVCPKIDEDEGENEQKSKRQVSLRFYDSGTHFYFDNSSRELIREAKRKFAGSVCVFAFSPSDISRLLSLLDIDGIYLCVHTYRFQTESVVQWQRICRALYDHRTLKTIQLTTCADCPLLSVILDSLPDKLVYFCGEAEKTSTCLLARRQALMQQVVVTGYNPVRFYYNHLFQIKTRTLILKSFFHFSALCNAGPLKPNPTLERIQLYAHLEHLSNSNEDGGCEQNIKQAKRYRRAMEWLREINKEKLIVNVDYDVTVSSDFPTMKVFRRKVNFILGNARILAKMANEVGLRVGKIEVEFEIHDTGPVVFDSDDLKTTFDTHPTIFKHEPNSWTPHTVAYSERFKGVDIVFRFLDMQYDE